MQRPGLDALAPCPLTLRVAIGPFPRRSTPCRPSRRRRPSRRPRPRRPRGTPGTRGGSPGRTPRTASGGTGTRYSQVTPPSNHPTASREAGLTPFSLSGADDARGLAGGGDDILEDGIGGGTLAEFDRAGGLDGRRSTHEGRSFRCALPRGFEHPAPQRGLRAC